MPSNRPNTDRGLFRNGKERLCNSPTHCPRTTVLSSRDSLASVFEPDAASRSLAEPTLELVREVEARELP